MQPIEPAITLTAAGVTAVPAVPAPRRAAAPAAADVAVERSADVAAFGRSTFAVFCKDQTSGATRIAIYDSDGNLLRVIPPHGVSDMESQISRYRFMR
jgi:hypothetical protein